ncbi:hypothetical protein H0H93_009266 [Arthromyces matolae]|nr:hypothetical protein H0H93_009266 [Arthromyces matolae]
MFVPFLSKRSPKGGGGGGRASSAGKSSSSSKGSSSSSSKAISSISGTSRTTSVSSKGGGNDVAMYSLAIQEYGLPESTVRFGGPLAIATFQSKALSNVSFSLYADTSSLSQIIPQVNSNCSSLVVPANYTPVAVLSNVTSTLPSPGSVIQYYRSSSAALLLESYNNTAAWTNTTTEDTPLPTDIDPQLLECLNSTIAAALPILDTPPGLDENDKFAISMGCIVGFGLLIEAEY